MMKQTTNAVLMIFHCTTWPSVNCLWIVLIFLMLQLLFYDLFGSEMRIRIYIPQNVLKFNSKDMQKKKKKKSLKGARSLWIIFTEKLVKIVCHSTTIWMLENLYHNMSYGWVRFPSTHCLVYIWISFREMESFQPTMCLFETNSMSGENSELPFYWNIALNFANKHTHAKTEN